VLVNDEHELNLSNEAADALIERLRH
jgi:hypothetical protein